MTMPQYDPTPRYNFDLMRLMMSIPTDRGRRSRISSIQTRYGDCDLTGKPQWSPSPPWSEQGMGGSWRTLRGAGGASR